MRPRLQVTSIAFITLCLSTALRGQEDSCSDVLRIGLRDSFEKVTSTTLAEAVYDWACSSEARDYSSKTSLGLSIPLPDFPAPIGGKFSSEDVDKWQKSHCESHWYNLNTTAYEHIAESVLSPIARDAINAWKDCSSVTRASANGVEARIGNYDPATDGRFTVHVKWNHVYPGQKEPTVSSDVRFDENAKCDAEMPKKGMPVGEHNSICTRTGEGRAILTFATNEGPLHPMLVLPAKPGKCDPNCVDCVGKGMAAICYEYQFKGYQRLAGGLDHVQIAELGSGFAVDCSRLPKGVPVDITASGNVWPDFVTIGNLHAGDSNGNVDWWINLVVDYDNGEVGGCGQGPLYTQHSIRTPRAPITLGARARTSKNGTIHASLNPSQVQMWPNTHGPLGLDREFTVTLKVARPAAKDPAAVSYKSVQSR